VSLGLWATLEGQMLRDARLYPADRSCFQYFRLLFLRVSFVIRSDREKGAKDS
jgi:hypothetical protein